MQTDSINNSPLFLYFLINPTNGEYYTATQEPNGAWVTVSQTASSDPIADKLFLKHSPTDLTFIKDGLAILLNLFKDTGCGGSEAKCILRIDIRQESCNYITIYQSELNFANATYHVSDQSFSITTLDSNQ